MMRKSSIVAPRGPVKTRSSVHLARAGTTLMEGLVVAFMLSLLTLLFWNAASEGWKREARVDFRTRALQTASLARAHLGEDLAQILPVPRPTLGVQQGPSITFERISHEGGEGGLPLTPNLAPKGESITYRFDPVSHRLLRNGLAVAVGVFRTVVFTYEARADRGYSVRVDLDMVPEDEVNAPTPSQKATFSFAFHSPQGTLALAHPEWVGDQS